ncbi:MAG: Nuclease-related domain protein [Pelotomaculum sp. PtaB.Bin104]|nr:MAG: Nuclease-related domain protein [Pelotomaculum sp. PtaB.Bin104]
MVARLVKQDDVLRKEFLRKVQAKIEAEKEVLKQYKPEEPSSFLGMVFKNIFGDSSDRQMREAQLKGIKGEADVAVKLRLGLPDEWVLINDVIVEPEPNIFAQTDHIVIGPPGLFVIETKACLFDKEMA